MEHTKVVEMSNSLEIPDGWELKFYTTIWLFKELPNGDMGGLEIIPMDNGLFDVKPFKVRPILLSKGNVVGKAGMAVDAEFEQKTGCVILSPKKQASVVMILDSEEVNKVQIVIQDPATDRVGRGAGADHQQRRGERDVALRVSEAVEAGVKGRSGRMERRVGTFAGTDGIRLDWRGTMRVWPPAILSR